MAYAVPAINPLMTRSEKRGPGERKRKDHQDHQDRQHYQDHQDAITGPQAFMLAPASVGPKTNQSGLLEAVSQRESEQAAFLVSQCTPTLNSGSGAGLQRSNTAGENQSPGLGSDPSYRQIAYNEYLVQAFGLSLEDKGKITEEQDNCTGADAVPPSRSHLSATSMELSFRLSLRERRPKIQLTIPRTKSKTYAAMPHGEMKGQRQNTPQGVSPPSNTSRNQIDSAGGPIRLSVVSPLSVVEMPKPRRPFSAFSIEEMTDGVPNSDTLLSKSASSDSSDDTGEQDGKFSTHSPHSSVSSLASDPAVVKPGAVNGFKRASPAASSTAVRGLTPKQSVSTIPRYPRGKRSIKSLHDGADRNKPLPPAPGPDAVKPLNYSTHSLGRTNSMQASRMTPRPHCASRQSSISSHKSLRSKYTPTNHDAGENPLTRSRSKTLDSPPQALLSSPTLSQAELELEAHLCSITEDLPLSSHEAQPIHDPRQISRGPMHMEPSRNPPSPHPSQVLVESPVMYEKMRPRRSVTHVAMQMRPGKELPRIPRKRVSAPLVGSNDKAHRVLGRNCGGAAAMTRRETSANSRWRPSESPLSSPNLSMDDPETPESERSPLISNATFEEVRQRLELLSPKSDALQDFLEFREQNRSGGEVTPPRHQSNARKPSSDTNSINSSPRPIEAATREQGRAVRGHHQTVPSPPVNVIPLLPERHFGRLEPRKQQHHDRSTTRSRSSTATKVPAIRASLPSSRLAEEEADRMISAVDAESVLLRILENLDNLQDLFAAARVSRGFYRTFKRHELHLMQNALYAMSPAAWELREISAPFPQAEDLSASSVSGYTPQLYLQRYKHDLYVMVALKTMILNRCESFLGADTITALAGGETERASHIDDAFWRIWSFCRLFGCDSKKEDDIVNQMDWLRGGELAKERRRTARTLDQSSDSPNNDTLFDTLPAFGRGNCAGLSAEELYDMTEIWTCLGVLVSGFQGKRELAREFGVFENSDIPVGDVQREDSMLEEWTHYLLTLAPPAILDVTRSTSPDSAPFAHARSRGYTAWSPPSQGISRSTFLKEAVTRVYQEKMQQRHPAIRAMSPERSPSAASETTTVALRQRMIAEIQAKRKDPGFKTLLPSAERPMSNFPEVLRKLEKSSVVTDDSSSTATISSLAPSSQVVTSGSGPTTPSVSLHHMHSRSPSFSILDETSVPVPDPSLGTQIRDPQVRDPADIALERLIEMGFEEKIAVKALANTDTGNNVDFDRALETLVRQRKRDVSKMSNWTYGGAVAAEVSRGSERRASPQPAVGLGIRGVERYA